uniref:Uncharacterized protein n=1 Tax=Oryctolagus cuniculus TaxID=9986 RepID=A0A5F9C258_RABIT
VKGGQIELGDVTPHNTKQLKRLNQVIFPVIFPLTSSTGILLRQKNCSKWIEPAEAHMLQKNLGVPSGQSADVDNGFLTDLKRFVVI